MTWLTLGLALFLGMHSVSIVAPAWRDAQVARRGELPWKALYTVVSIAGFVLIVIGYGAVRQTPIVLYAAPGWTRHLTMLLMVPARGAQRAGNGIQPMSGLCSRSTA